MSIEKDKDLDDLFRKKLEDPVDPVGYNEADWDALEGMLGKRSKKGIVYWLPVLGSVAALLLVFFGYLVLRHPASVVKPGNGQQAVIPSKKDTITKNGAINRQAIVKPKTDTILPPAAVNKGANQGTKPLIPAGSMAVNPKRNKSGGNNISGSNPAPGSKTSPASIAQKPVLNDAVSSRSDAVLVAYNVAPSLQDQLIINQQITQTNLQASATANPANAPVGNKVRIKAKTGFQPRYAISILAAPDINGVGSFQQSKVGTNEGLLFSVGVSKKLTFSTGAIYSVKPYITPFEDYHTPYHFAVSPINVTADCRMLDIPLNVGYQVYSKHQNTLSLGTGLSSYIMLHESYKFNYADIYANGPANFTVPNSNKYFFGVLNLNATFQHQVNSKVGFSVQPYMKLPLTNIGYSQVRLQTTGVAIGLNWNLNSSSKP